MIYRIFILLKREYNFYLRDSNALLGIFVFNSLLTITICALFRNLQLSKDEIGLVVSPYLWVILMLSVFRILLQNISEECQKGLFLKQIRDGYQSHEIFISKLISAFVTISLLLVIQTAVFIWLIGFKEILAPLLYVSLVYLIALPALVSLSFIGAYIALRSAAEEVLMPIILLPMLLLLSIATVTVAENSFTNVSLDFNYYWFKLVLGLQVLFVIISEFLFRIISRLKI